MALVDPENYQGPTAAELLEKKDGSVRAQCHSLQVKTFGEVVTEESLPVLTPVARNSSTGFWVPWDANGSNATDTMLGLVWPEAITLSEDGEVQGSVMLAGKVHYEDILAAVEERAVEVEADLATELKAGPRDLGILVYGLPDVR